MIDAEHRAGTLSDWERTVIFERFTTAYGTRNLDEAKQTLASTWNSLCNALKKAEQPNGMGKD